MLLNIAYLIVIYCFKYIIAHEKHDYLRRLDLVNTNEVLPKTLIQRIQSPYYRRECPLGFSFIGKQCIKIITAPLKHVCPPHTTMHSNRCIYAVEEVSKCPPGSIASGKTCIRTETAVSIQACPSNFTLHKTNKCVRRLPLPPKLMCPTNAVLKGDTCVRKRMEVPEYVCPNEFQFLNNKCQRVELYDCTPIRSMENNTKLQQEQHNILPPFVSNNTKLVLNNTITHNILYQIEPVIEEYVVQTLCKRIITERARLICHYNGTLNENMCESDVPVDFITKLGGFEEEMVNATESCPEGYWNSENDHTCIKTKDTAPESICVYPAVIIDGKCVVQLPIQTECPEGFWLKHNVCTKMLFTHSYVEYNVTYRCRGDSCDDLL